MTKKEIFDWFDDDLCYSSCKGNCDLEEAHRRADSVCESIDMYDNEMISYMVEYFLNEK
jgi:hypothetical protein